MFVECGGRGKGVSVEGLKVCGVWWAWEGGHWSAAEGLWSVEGVGRGLLECG
jgi:hypothetical protein